ncbi:MAG: Glyoxylate reductase [Promethearchaeota archaeon]|nr:MAG: Glyoxylate reductase [Candidatus Lokiarchaeota archaeon]
MKTKVYLTSNVFSPQEIGQNEKIQDSLKVRIEQLWHELESNANLKVFEGRFPTKSQLQQEIGKYSPQIIGCHLSHPISENILDNSDIFAVSTSTAGFNHIERPEKDDIIITHTPGVLFETVADYTIALIMANLRNLIDLHNYVWDGQWSPDEKWDLDQKLSSVIDNKVVGIVGLGEIGTELMKRLYAWNLKIIYYDKYPKVELEKLFPGLEYKENIEDLFNEADVVSLHVPLNSATKHMVDADLLTLMKPKALLVNTARGGVINFDDLLELLESGEIDINFSLDVFPEEPLDPSILRRLKAIKEKNPGIRMILMPHNASADADTRGKMVIMLLEDILKIIDSKKIIDLETIHLIPPHKKKLYDEDWRIFKYWEKK